MNGTKSEPETGVVDDVPFVPTTADVYAYADGGQHATLWAVSRTSDTTVDVLKFRREDSHVDQDGPVREYTVDPATETDEFALDLADDNPRAAVDAAEVHFSEDL